MLVMPLWILFNLGMRFLADIVRLNWLHNFLIVCSGGSNLYLFLIGLLLAEVANYINETKVRVVYLFYYLLDMVFIFYFYKTRITIAALIITCVVFLAIYKRLVIVELRPLIYLGGISYTVYLIHQNVGYVIINCLSAKMPFAIAVVIAIIVSVLFWNCLQKLVEDFLKRKNSRD